mgnify:CR=1 FL=1
MAIIDESSNIVDVLVSFKTITNHVSILGNFTGLFQVLHNIDIKGRRSFDMNIVFQSLIENVLKMGAFGTVTIVVLTCILVFFNGGLEPSLRSLEIICYVGQLGEL